MKTAIYTRVSKTDDSQTTENQVLELRQYAQAMNWDCVVFEEKESSRKSRPIKNKIFQEAINKKYDLILVWKLDRWARSLQELVNDLSVLEANKVQFVSLKDNIKLDNNPTNRLMVHILGAFAQFERDVIRTRTLAGLERAKSNGTKLGRPKGSKDKKRRRKSGYLLRWQKEKIKV